MIMTRRMRRQNAKPYTLNPRPKPAKTCSTRNLKTLARGPRIASPQAYNLNTSTPNALRGTLISLKPTTPNPKTLELWSFLVFPSLGLGQRAVQEETS